MLTALSLIVDLVLQIRTLKTHRCDGQGDKQTWIHAIADIDDNL